MNSPMVLSDGLINRIYNLVISGIDKQILYKIERQIDNQVYNNVYGIIEIRIWNQIEDQLDEYYNANSRSSHNASIDEY